MYELIFEGRVQGRGSQDMMRVMRREIADYTGRDISVYKIERVSA